MGYCTSTAIFYRGGAEICFVVLCVAFCTSEADWRRLYWFYFDLIILDWLKERYLHSLSADKNVTLLHWKSSAFKLLKRCYWSIEDSTFFNKNTTVLIPIRIAGAAFSNVTRWFLLLRREVTHYTATNQHYLFFLQTKPINR